MKKPRWHLIVRYGVHVFHHITHATDGQYELSEACVCRRCGFCSYFIGQMPLHRFSLSLWLFWTLRSLWDIRVATATYGLACILTCMTLPLIAYSNIRNRYTCALLLLLIIINVSSKIMENVTGAPHLARIIPRTLRLMPRFPYILLRIVYYYYLPV